MSTVPEDAEISDDGCWWWDGENWQPIEGNEGNGDAGEGNGEEPGGQGNGDEPGEPGFDFDVNGVRVDPEDSPVPSDGEPLKIAFAVCNTGSAEGVAVVTLYIDGNETDVVWESPVLQPGECATPDGDGYVHDVPGQSEGDHRFEVFVDPPGEYGGTTSNEIHVGSPEG